MQRFDLRHLKSNFYEKMQEIIEIKLKSGEVAIFLFELGDHGNIAKSAETIINLGHILLNSLPFNRVDWTIVIKKK